MNISITIDFPFTQYTFNRLVFHPRKVSLTLQKLAGEMYATVPATSLVYLVGKVFEVFV